MNDEDELRDFHKKLWKFIEEHSPSNENKSNVLMISGVLLSACLRLYVSIIGKKDTVNMFNAAIKSIEDINNRRTLH